MTVTEPMHPRNTPGTIGFVFAILTVVFTVGDTYVRIIVPYQSPVLGLSPTTVGFILSFSNVLTLLVAVAATALGAFGATRPGAPKLTSGIALGVGAFGVILCIVSLTMPVLLQFVYTR